MTETETLAEKDIVDRTQIELSDSRGDDGHQEQQEDHNEPESDNDQSNDESTPPSSPQLTAEDSTHWYYLDSYEKQQGPFGFDEIRTWWMCGYFDPQLPIRRGGESDFGPISTREEIISKQIHRQKLQLQQEQDLQKQEDRQVEEDQEEAQQQLHQQIHQQILQQQQQDLEQQIEQQTFYPSPALSFPTYPMLHAGQKRGAAGFPLPGMYFPASLPPFPYPRVMAPNVPSYENSDYPSIDDEFQQYKFTAQFNTRTGKFQSSGSLSYWQGKRLPDDPEGRQLAHYFDFEAYQEAMRNTKRVKPKKPKKPKTKKKVNSN